MSESPFVPIGRVVKTHGLKGEVSVAVAAGPPFVLSEGLAVWFVPPAPGLPREATITSVRPGPKGPLAAFSGVSGIDAASRLVGREILARADDLPDEVLDEYESDMTGYSVTDVVHGSLGEVVETIVTGANDVWIVEGPLGEVLIPVIDDVVLEVDDVAEAISVRLLDGLLPGTGDSA